MIGEGAPYITKHTLHPIFWKEEQNFASLSKQQAFQLFFDRKRKKHIEDYSWKFD